MVEDHGGAHLRCAYLKPNILQRQPSGVPRVEAIGRHRSQHEVFTRDFGKVTPRGVFSRASPAEGEVNIVEGDVLHGCITDAVQRDAGKTFTRVGFACDLCLGELWRVRGNGAADIAEGDVAGYGWRPSLLRQCWLQTFIDMLILTGSRADTDVDRPSHLLQDQVGKRDIFKARSFIALKLDGTSEYVVEDAVGDGDIFRYSATEAEDRPSCAEDGVRHCDEFAAAKHRAGVIL